MEGLMPPKKSLFWSNLETFESCPQKYLWGSGWGDLDVGGGPGRPKPKPVRESRHHALMGLVLSAGVERLYNDEMYREPKTLAERLDALVCKEFEFLLTREYVNWNESPPRAELLETVRKGMRNYIEIMRANRLLGPYARSEVNLEGWVDTTTMVAGRPDLIVRRDDNGVSIYDGKNGKNPAHSDPDQLRWYALCFYLQHKVLPNRLAFACFRYPPGHPPSSLKMKKEAWTGLVEVPLTSEHLRDLGARARRVRLAMLEEKFDPTPSSEACKFCVYRSECDAYGATRKRRAKGAPAPGSLESKIESGGGGIVELSLTERTPQKG